MGVETRFNVVSYVVRIYRRTTGRGENPETLTGLVESDHDHEQRPFHSMVELWDILRARGAGHGSGSGKSVPDTRHDARDEGKKGRSR